MFKVVPLRLGVDEVGTAGFARSSGCRTKTGLALAIVRKVRMIFWAAAGGVLLVREGLSPDGHAPCKFSSADELSRSRQPAPFAVPCTSSHRTVRVSGNAGAYPTRRPKA